MTFEVIPRRIEDRGGGLGLRRRRVRLVEGLAMPREADEFHLSYYNTLTTWIDLDKLLAGFGLSRVDLSDGAKVSAAIRAMAAKVPTYITLKDVKKPLGPRPGGRVPGGPVRKALGRHDGGRRHRLPLRRRAEAKGPAAQGPAQLDGWLRDGSAYVRSRCASGVNRARKTRRKPSRKRKEMRPFSSRERCKNTAHGRTGRKEDSSG